MQAKHLERKAARLRRQAAAGISSTWRKFESLIKVLVASGALREGTLAATALGQVSVCLGHRLWPLLCFAALAWPSLTLASEH